MWTDPLVEEIRQFSEQYAAKFEFDLVKIFHDLREKQNKGGQTVVSFPSKKYKASPRLETIKDS